MAAAGKKGKKAKWIPANITDIFAESTAISTTHNWADSVEEEPETFTGYGSRTRAPVVLPSASRAARGGLAVDDDAIPKRPPFVAHISNLPYDVDETAITELFEGLKITNLRLPREGERLKGYGYVDFEDRESLINAMNMPDLTISGRRIRIDVSIQDNNRGMGRSGMGRSDRERDYDPERTMGDWRSGPRAVPETPSRPRPTMDRERDRDREREPDREPEEVRPGAWRDGDRPSPPRAPYGGRESGSRDKEDRYQGRERTGYGGRDGFRTAEREGGGFGNRDRSFGSRGFGDRDRGADRDPPPKEESRPKSRPKLNLLPRTVPLEAAPPATPAEGAVDDPPPEKPAPKPVPKEKVFGAAKPVDTAAKEREIEERLRKQEEEARKATEEKERWTRKSDHSGDRHTGARRDDRGKDTRGDKPRRDYSKDDRDRRDDRPRRDDDRRRDDYPRRDDDRPRKDDRGRRDDRDDRGRRDERDDRGRRDDRDDRGRRDERKDDRDDRGRRDERDDRGRRDERDDRGRRDERDDRGRIDDRRRDDVRRDDRDDRRRDDREGGRRDDWDDKRRDDRREPQRRDSREELGERRDTNGDARPRHDDKPLPKLKEQEKPNFVASNKFSFLDADVDGDSD